MFESRTTDSEGALKKKWPDYKQGPKQHICSHTDSIRPTADSVTNTAKAEQSNNAREPFIILTQKVRMIPEQSFSS